MAEQVKACKPEQDPHNPLKGGRVEHSMNCPLAFRGAQCLSLSLPPSLQFFILKRRTRGEEGEKEVSLETDGHAISPVSDMSAQCAYF